MTPYPSLGKEEGGYFSLIPGKNDRGPTMQFCSTPKVAQLFRIMPDFAKLLANQGNNLIIDEVLFSDSDLKPYIDALSNHVVYFIGVFCDLATMQEREMLRRDRAIGLSNDQINRVHTGSREYDLKVDTSAASPFQVATQILTFLESTPAPEGFINTQKKIKDFKSKMAK